MTNKYVSSTSAITSGAWANKVVIPGEGTMFNETTNIKPTRNRVNENTNTYAVTVPVHIKRKVKKSRKPKSRKVKK